MPRKRKTCLVETVETPAMKESDHPPAKLRNIANLVKNSEDTLFGSSIFSNVTLSAVNNELQCSSGGLSVGTIFKRKGNPKSDNSSDDVIDLSDDCVILSQGSRQPPAAQRVQYSKGTLEAVSKLEALQKAIESEEPFADDSLDDVVCLDTAADEEKMIFRVLCSGRLVRFALDPEARLAAPLEEIAKECGVPVAQIVVCDDDGNTVEPEDTPRSVGFKPGTIYQCIVRRFMSVPPSQPTVPKKSTVTVKFQCATRRKPELVKIAEDEPLQEGVREFAEIAGLDPSNIVVEFDGERVDPGKTPKDLGIEDGDCVDVSAAKC